MSMSVHCVKDLLYCLRRNHSCVGRLIGKEQSIHFLLDTVKTLVSHSRERKCQNKFICFFHNNHSKKETDKKNIYVLFNNNNNNIDNL